MSNYVRDAFNPDVWAIGQIAGLSDGDSVAAGAQMTFALDVNDPTIRAYLQGRLNLGEVDFMAISMYEGGGIGGDPIPRFDTLEELGGAAPVLNISLVPEPGTLLLLGAGAFGLATFGRRRA